MILHRFAQISARRPIYTIRFKLVLNCFRMQALQYKALVNMIIKRDVQPHKEKL